MPKPKFDINMKGSGLAIKVRDRVLSTKNFAVYMQAYNQKAEALCDACERLEAYWVDTEHYDANEYDKIKFAVSVARQDLQSFLGN